jgi:hypothetical protein
MSANKMDEEIDHHRRLFLATAVMAIAAAECADYFVRKTGDRQHQALCERGTQGIDGAWLP